MVPVGDASADALSSLMDRRRALKAERQAVTRAMRNEEKKRQRRLERARGLSHEDLLVLVGAKAAAKAKAKAKAEAKAKAKPKAEAKAKAEGPPPPSGGSAGSAGSGS